MRIKTLTRYNFSTIKMSIFIFYLFFMCGTLLGSVLNSLIGDNTVVFGVTGDIDGIRQTWSSGIFAFSIFMLISSLIGSQKDTRFLITRSVSRKEVFVANAIFLGPLAATMSVLQIISIYIDGFVRLCFGGDWRGISLDIQHLQAPDMNNIFVFFTVSFSILFMFGALSYLFGSLLARWKITTIAVASILFILLISVVANADLITRIYEILKFMFVDNSTGLFIAIKQILFGITVLVITFPIMRKITIAK